MMAPFICNFLGLEPKTVLSQWYPTKNLYLDRPCEGMYLLPALPALAPRQLNMDPKPLVKGCKIALDDLKTRINEHYNIGDPSRESWNKWFALHAPANEDVSNYVLTHRYTCPLAGYFKSTVNYQPRWEIPQPVCSFSIFPQNVVLALPSIRNQFDPQGTSAPFQDVPTDIFGEENNSILRHYTFVKVQEMERMKRLKGARLKELLSRKVKENGAKYSTNAVIEVLCSTLFECNVHFLSSRYCDLPQMFHFFKVTFITLMIG